MTKSGSAETSRVIGPFRRLRLQRSDGRVYLDRWGIGWDRVGRVFVHRMNAPDPDPALHDHPWSFLSIILRGGYIEERIEARDAQLWAGVAEVGGGDRGFRSRRGPGSMKVLRLDEAHTVKLLLNGRTSWSLVIAGPRRRRWGFYTGDGWVDWTEHEGRDLFVARKIGRQR